MDAKSNFPPGMSDPTQWVNFIMGKDSSPKKVDQSGRKETTSERVHKMTQQIFPSLDSLQSSYSLLKLLEEAVANPKKIKEIASEGNASSVTAIFEEANKRYLGDEKGRAKFETNLAYAVLTVADELSTKMGFGRLQLKDGDKLTPELIQKLPIDFQAEGFHNMLHMLLWSSPNEDKALAVLDRKGAKDLILRRNIENVTPLQVAVHTNAAAVVEKMLSMISFEEFKQLPEIKTIFKTAFLQMLEAPPPEESDLPDTGAAAPSTKQQKEAEAPGKIWQLLEAKAGDDKELQEKMNKAMSEVEEGLNLA